jgi:hypothetical protein
MPAWLTGILGAIKGASVTAKIISITVAVLLVGGGAAVIIIANQDQNEPAPEIAQTNEEEEKEKEDEPDEEIVDEEVDEADETGQTVTSSNNTSSTGKPDNTNKPGGSGSSNGSGNTGGSTTTTPPSTPKADYNLNEGYYLGVKKFGGKDSWGMGYFPNACSWVSGGVNNSGTITPAVMQYSDGRDCSNDYYRLVDGGIVVMNNLCSVENAVSSWVSNEKAKATAAGYKWLGGYGASAGCDAPDRIANEKITEAICSKYVLSCGRW